MLKLTMYAAFADELEKIASVGAMVGGYAGYRLAPNDLKGKVTGAIGGALAGHVVGEGLQAAKRSVIDDPRARERAELYGYTSPPPQPTNF